MARTSSALPSYHSFDAVLAVGAVDAVRASAGTAFADLEAFAGKWAGEWMFGHFGYELTRETMECAADKEANPAGFPDLFFFVPEVVIEICGDMARIGCREGDPARVWEEIGAMPAEIGAVPGEVRARSEKANARSEQMRARSEHVDAMPGQVNGHNDGHASPGTGSGIRLEPAFTKEEYLATVEALRLHILRGDCYEINFCQEFYSPGAYIDPLATWTALSGVSPNPFSCFYRVDDSYLLCASPERYLRREGDTLISQPIKGTASRRPGDRLADVAAGAGLRASAKDRSENVMVVDLVRNDLSRVCTPGSVHVEELFGVYSFPQVFQMISTVKGEMLPGIGLAGAIKATFPMGSMTGAPKRRVVELIGQYERVSRGLFSGAVGYVRPGGDFDFNVVIRSLFYNAASGYLSYLVGSGITFYSDPALEYAECLMKAEGIKKALGH